MSNRKRRHGQQARRVKRIFCEPSITQHDDTRDHCRRHMAAHESEEYARRVFGRKRLHGRGDAA